jgi:hypothetical protein
LLEKNAYFQEKVSLRSPALKDFRTDRRRKRDEKKAWKRSNSLMQGFRALYSILLPEIQ